MSRRNALIQRSQGGTNGTFVNGQRIQQATHLRPGDEVRLGSNRFLVDGGQ